MSEKLLDIIGAVLWFTMFVTPLITIPIAWKLFPVKKIYRVIIGLLLACPPSFLLYHISLGIIFRHGLGPDAVY